MKFKANAQGALLQAFEGSGRSWGGWSIHSFHIRKPPKMWLDQESKISTCKLLSVIPAVGNILFWLPRFMMLTFQQSGACGFETKGSGGSDMGRAATSSLGSLGTQFLHRDDQVIKLEQRSSTFHHTGTFFGKVLFSS